MDTVFFERLNVLFFLELASRRIVFTACSEHPGGGWAVQQARSLAWELEEAEIKPRFLNHDRGSNFPAAFDAVIRAEGLEVRITACQPADTTYQGVGAGDRDWLDHGRLSLNAIPAIDDRPLVRDSKMHRRGHRIASRVNAPQSGGLALGAHLWHQERPVHQPLDQVRDLSCRKLPVGTDLLGRLDRESADEDRKPVAQGLLQAQGPNSCGRWGRGLSDLVRRAAGDRDVFAPGVALGISIAINAGSDGVWRDGDRGSGRRRVPPRWLVRARPNPGFAADLSK